MNPQGAVRGIATSREEKEVSSQTYFPVVPNVPTHLLNTRFAEKEIKAFSKNPSWEVSGNKSEVTSA